MFRNRSQQSLYAKYLDSESVSCGFCSLEPSRIVRLYEHMAVIKNQYPYSYWDACAVVEHLLIVSVTHVTKLDMLSSDARAELHTVIDEFVSQGYSAYLRPAGSPSSSMAHFHCHLCGLVSPRISFQIFSRRPYWLWVRTK
jgi:diadenosine tetraphosphate (Ap4A) HIT family hydrolase